MQKNSEYLSLRWSAKGSHGNWGCFWLVREISCASYVTTDWKSLPTSTVFCQISDTASVGDTVEDTRLRRITEHVTDNLNRRCHTAAAFQDVQEAFDRIWHDGLIVKLIWFRFVGYLIRVIQFFLSNCSIRARVGKEFPVSRLITAGLLQGTCLYPILFNSYSADIPTHPRVMNAFYADDISFIQSNTIIAQVTLPFQNHFLSLQRWYPDGNFNINKQNRRETSSKRPRLNNPKLFF